MTVRILSRIARSDELKIACEYAALFVFGLAVILASDFAAVHFAIGGRVAP